MSEVKHEVLLQAKGIYKNFETSKKDQAVHALTNVDLTLYRGETLAALHGLRVFPCPFPIPGFTVRQHWHSRYHNDPGNRWLRGLCANLFLRDRSGE